MMVSSGGKRRGPARTGFAATELKRDRLGGGPGVLQGGHHHVAGEELAQVVLDDGQLPVLGHLGAGLAEQGADQGQGERAGQDQHAADGRIVDRDAVARAAFRQAGQGVGGMLNLQAAQGNLEGTRELPSRFLARQSGRRPQPAGGALLHLAGQAPRLGEVVRLRLTHWKLYSGNRMSLILSGPSGYRCRLNSSRTSRRTRFIPALPCSCSIVRSWRKPITHVCRNGF